MRGAIGVLALAAFAVGFPGLAAGGTRVLQFSQPAYVGVAGSAMQVQVSLADAGAAVPDTSVELDAQCAEGGACAVPFGSPATTDGSGHATFTLLGGASAGDLTVVAKDLGSGAAAQATTATVSLRASSTTHSLRFNGNNAVHTGSVGYFDILVTDRPAQLGGNVIPGTPVVLQGGCNAQGACITVDPPTGVATNDSGTAVFKVHANFGGTGPVPMLMIDSSTGAATIMDAQVEPLWNFQDMWWAGPKGNGWGMSVLQHDDRVVAIIFAYDDQGNPTWYIMPDGKWDETRQVINGSMYTPHGTPFYAYQANNLVVGDKVGDLQLQMNSPTSLSFVYTVQFRDGGDFLVREPFGAGSPVGDHADLWWGGSSQNGQGITILEQAPTIFPIWYTYDAAGKAIWYAVPVGSFTSPGVFEGRAYKTRSSSWLYDTYDATKLQATDVGSFVLHFNGTEAATLDYNIEGHGGTLPLVREPF